MVSVQTGSTCLWHFTSSASWVSAVGNGSGAGPVALTLLVGSNQTTGIRTATVTIGGQTLKVTQAAPSVIVSRVTLAKTYVAVGTTVNGNTIVLASPAPLGGTTVQLKSSSLAIGIPAIITVPPGSSVATFALTGQAIGGPVLVSAVLGGSTAVADALYVVANTIVSVGVAAPSVPGGTGVSLSFRLAAPAPNGGSIIALCSTLPGVASVPASVTVPAGSTTGSLVVQTIPVLTDQSILVTVSIGNSSMSVPLTVRAAKLYALSSTAVQTGARSGSRIIVGPYLDGGAPVPIGANISLSSSNPSVLPLPGTVSVPAGKTSTTFYVAVGFVSSPTPVTISATYNGITVYASVVVSP